MRAVVGIGDSVVVVWVGPVLIGRLGGGMNGVSSRRGRKLRC